MTSILRTSPHGERVARIMAAALSAVDPKHAVGQFIRRDGTILGIGQNEYDLEKFKRVLVIGFGKASIPMGQAATEILGNYIDDGLLITKVKESGRNLKLKIHEGAHPIPDRRSITGTQKILDLLATTTQNDLVICLISGGGSALLTLPAPGISLDDIQMLTKLLLGCGATINEINCLRKHLSRVKGGQLVRWAAPAQSAALILSDVVSDPLDVIASGPTIPDPTTFQDALGILEKYQVVERVPVSIQSHLARGQKGEIPETPKAGDPVFEAVQNTLVGNNYLAAKAGIEQAKAEGFNTLLLTTALQGEAREAGKFLASIVKQVATTGEPIPRPACIIAGGETTVTLRGNGLGGRNQEVALAAVSELIGVPKVMLVTLATDGDDGPTDAAGAIVTGETWERAQIFGLNPSEFLAKNNAYNFFDPLGNLLKPGPTQTNVNDLTFLLAF